MRKFSAWSKEHEDIGLLATTTLPAVEFLDAAMASLWSIAYSGDYEGPILEGTVRDALILTEFNRWVRLPRVVKA